MKHAFIFGTNIFLSDENTLTYTEGDNSVEFLKIQRCNEHRNNTDDGQLVIEAAISLSSGESVIVLNNQVVEGKNISIKIDRDRVNLYRTGHFEPILDVYQIDEAEYDGLPSYIAKEIEAQQPNAVFTIKGDFMVEKAHIVIQNEKMYINNDDFGGGVTNAHHGVVLSADTFSY